MGTKFAQLLESKQVLISDGATGSNLIARGLPRGKTAEDWVLEKPEEILRLHQDFVNAGSNIILTSTFGASDIRLNRSGMGGRAAEVNAAAVSLARQAVGGRETLVAGSIGPLGEILKPLGTLDEETAEKNYYQQAQSLDQSGVDILLIETQFDLAEAAIAVKAACHLPAGCP